MHLKTLGQCPVLTLLLELKQTAPLARHTILTHNSFFLQPKHGIEVSHCGPSAMIIVFGDGRLRIVLVALGDVVHFQIAICILMGSDAASSPAGPNGCHAIVLRNLACGELAAIMRIPSL